MRRQSQTAWVACVLLSILSCSRGSRKPQRRDLSEAERGTIAAFTQGVISRESSIRVLLAEAVIEPSQLNSPLADSPFKFDPPIKGTAVWTTSNQVEYRPADRLPDGQTYSAALDLSRLPPDKVKISRFAFDFSTMTQTFSVALDGLEAADPQDSKKQRLTGKLVTADVEDAAKVEQVLQVTQPPQTLKIEWVHEANRRTHAFTVRGILRGEDPSKVLVSWDGHAIGVEKRENQEVVVPGLNTFSVDQARAVQGKEQYVELRFTDVLKTPQNLNGLIQIGQLDDLRFTISGSIVNVYSAKSFRGEQTVRVAPGIRNVLGYRLREGRDLSVSFEALKPQVRFVGKGVIVPTSNGLTIPIEAVNLRAVTVEALRIPDLALPQFFQVNDLPGDHELNRVGRVVWNKTLPLDITPDKENRAVAVGLDLTPLTKANPGGLYRLSLSFRRPDIIWSCQGQAAVPEPAQKADSGDGQESSYWDTWEEEGADWNTMYENRDNPCHPAYYRTYYDHNIKVGRNVLVSDVGLLAKEGEDDEVSLIATDLRTTAPISGAEVTLRDFQQQVITTGKTGGNGIARLKFKRKPFLAVVRSGDQTGYLRLDDGTALSMAHFDIAGVKAPKGLKGFLYGERGVWRPGDTLYLSFILVDPGKRLTGAHPARFELINSRGQVVKTLTRPSSTDGFYTFEVATSPDAPTGNYTGRVTVGGATFDRTLKIETIMPNRLKIALDFGQETLSAGTRVAAVLKSTWLHGAPARSLKADVEMALSSAPTRFPRYEEYVFDDPTRKYETEKQKVFEGQLDESGQAKIDALITAENVAPGKLTANFTTRVFEPGGAFSIDRFSIPYSPYKRYVGIRTPKGDQARGMLLTDTRQLLDIVTLDAQGKPVGDAEIEVKLYKVGWRWWWERGEEDLTTYAESTVQTPLQSGAVALKNGVGSWGFEIKYPDWGRYLITATDREGKHRAAKIVYIDWPGWAGRGQKEMPGGATVLTFAPDKSEYTVGDTVTLTLPTPKKGRALVSIESGSRVLRMDWLEATGTETRFSFRATPEMAPNVYANVTLLQPHAQTGNDLPIRLYGVAPIRVSNPETRLKPILECADVLAPEAAAKITVRETSGRPMTYTLAVVDEGLLGLTRYSTPDPWDFFYAREALAVKTWDLYDHVVGAYGAAMERMLAIGGGDEGSHASVKRANRFPPMVRFLGPFPLARGAVNRHSLDIPKYVGAVRVMVVAGHEGSFGATEKSVFVRRPLMILATLPRVPGPEEDATLPVSVFALEPSVREVTLSLSTSGLLTVIGPATQKVSFKAVGDELVNFRVGTKGPGVGSAIIRAVAGAEHTEQSIELDVRMQTQRTVDVIGTSLKPEESWRPPVVLPGQPGTNELTLEVSRIPPLDLGRRLEYLVQYPHGCVEQTVSAVFPQLFLNKLLELSPEMQARTETNVKAGLERLKQFQTSVGGFGYWPGDNDANDWASSYAGHFVVEAQKVGYFVPAGLIDQWTAFQRRRSRAWVPGPVQAELTQAYRLYTLALAGAPELAPMNQLRERGELPVAAKWRLAAAYQLAGQPEAARALARDTPVSVKPYHELAFTFGSDLRDRAMILEALATLGLPEQIGPLAKGISESLSKNQWLSTQETAYALLALARASADTKSGAQTAFTYVWNGATLSVTSGSPVVQRKLVPGPKSETALVLRNSGPGVLYPRLLLSGLPPVGRETSASNGLKLELEYLSPSGAPLDPARLEQGTDFKVVAKVTNLGVRGDLQELALSHILASGWEIHNQRMDTFRRGASSPFEYQDIRDDRVYTYFGLRAGETKSVEVLVNASYLGKYYLPMVSVEAMYDASLNARTKGQWVQVTTAGARP